MNLFYCPDISGEFHYLTEEESKHCTRVLRLKAGDDVLITDGMGRTYQCKLTDDHPKRCTVRVISVETSPRRAGYRLHIAIAPTKNIERYEWFLEKATEIGIDEITPIICHRSERTVVKHERQMRILISATKQSLNSWIPVLHDAVDFNQFIELNHKGNRFIASCENGNEPHLGQLIDSGMEMVVLVGPEGDFSPEELNFAISHGYKPVSLGTNRLRTETAGVVVCCMAMKK